MDFKKVLRDIIESDQTQLLRQIGQLYVDVEE